MCIEVTFEWRKGPYRNCPECMLYYVNSPPKRVVFICIRYNLKNELITKEFEWNAQFFLQPTIYISLRFTVVTWISFNDWTIDLITHSNSIHRRIYETIVFHTQAVNLWFLAFTFKHTSNACMYQQYRLGKTFNFNDWKMNDVEIAVYVRTYLTNCLFLVINYLFLLNMHDKST